MKKKLKFVMKAGTKIRINTPYMSTYGRHGQVGTVESLGDLSCEHVVAVRFNDDKCEAYGVSALQLVS